MVSGKYSALAGAISREQAIANISNNLANINTSGYKKSMVSFESILRGEQQSNEAKGINYNRIKNNFGVFTPGALRQTNDPLDVAINGDGFFKILGPEGVLYTRRGDFTIDEEGNLLTNAGQPVLDEGNGPINIPDTDTDQIAIDDEGTIYTLGPQGSRQEVSKLAVVSIADQSKLTRVGDTSYSLDEGGQEQINEDFRVVQGNLELSNVNMAEEMAAMIDSYRTFETYHKVLKSYSTISEQQEELGTLG